MKKFQMVLFLKNKIIFCLKHKKTHQIPSPKKTKKQKKSFPHESWSEQQVSKWIKRLGSSEIWQNYGDLILKGAKFFFI